MTCIAWDGKTLAADKRSTQSGVARTTTKIRRVQREGGDPELLAWTGTEDSCHMLAKWYADGADPAKWPKCQEKDDDWGRLIVVSSEGVRVYDRQPVGVKVEDAFSAWGSGRDFALAAMHLGHNAVVAVATASVFVPSCGNGVDAMTL